MRRQKQYVLYYRDDPESVIGIVQATSKAKAKAEARADALAIGDEKANKIEVATYYDMEGIFQELADIITNAMKED